MTIMDHANAIARPHFLLRWRNWTHNLGRFLAQHNVTANDISLLGVMFAATAGAAFYFSLQPDVLDRALLLLLAAAAIQLHRLTGRLHTIVSRESVQPRPHAIFYDLPNRIAEVLILVPAGYAVQNLPFGLELAWSAALLGLFSAYVRQMGSGVPETRSGVTVKNLPMMLLSAASLLSVFDRMVFLPGIMLWIALIVMNLALIFSIWQRTLQIVHAEETE
jgi:hypothetical protein